MNNSLANRCAEKITSNLTADVGVSLVLGGSISAPFVTQTFKLAYNTVATDKVKRIPVHITNLPHWQSGFATFDHDTNTISFDEITESSNAGEAILTTGNAIIYVEMIPDMALLTVEHIKPTGANDQDLINEASLDLVAIGGGQIILVDDTYEFRSPIFIHPKIYINGAGMDATRAVVNTSVPAFDVFSFDSTVSGYGANQQGWGLSNIMIRAYSANTDVRGINSKVSTYSMQDIRLNEVNFDGFSDSRSSSNPIMDIRDPWGLRIFNCITEQSGNRPVLKITGNGSSNNGAMVMFNKFKRNDGDNITLQDCNRCMITHNELYNETAGKYDIILNNSNLNIVDHNQSEFSTGNAYHITNNSDGNVLTGNVAQNAVSAANGILIDSGCSGNTIIGGTITGFAANVTDNGSGNRIFGVWGGTNYVDLPDPFTTQMAENTTTGDTAKDFTNIPTGVKQININFNDLSTNGTAYPRILIGDSGGFETTGYTGSTGIMTTGPVIVMHGASASWPLYDASNWLGGNILSGTVTLNRLSSDGTKWTITGVLAAKSDVTIKVSGVKTLSAELTQIRVTMDGVDQFDSGSMNANYRY